MESGLGLGGPVGWVLWRWFAGARRLGSCGRYMPVAGYCPDRRGAASTLAQVSAIRGREAEIAVLTEALDLVESGRRAVVLIEGEAGIGKTRLLGAALEDARQRGMQVAAGRAEELEGMRPFGLMTGVFGCTRSATDPRRAAIGELLSGGAGERNPITVTSDPGLRFRVV